MPAIFTVVVARPLSVCRCRRQLLPPASSDQQQEEQQQQEEEATTRTGKQLVVVGVGDDELPRRQQQRPWLLPLRGGSPPQVRPPPCFRTSLFGRTHVFVSSPDAARALLAAADSAAFSKRYVRTVADLLGEHSLLCASHERHRSLRRALAPLFFNAQTTASLAASFDALTVQAISGWSFSPSSSSVVVVLDAALGITFEAICGMLVGTLLRHDNKERMQSDVLAVTQAMLAFPLRMPGTRFHAGLQVVVAYNSYSSHIYIYI
jgi:cytochrome P450